MTKYYDGPAPEEYAHGGYEGWVLCPVCHGGKVTVGGYYQTCDHCLGIRQIPLPTTGTRVGGVIRLLFLALLTITIVIPWQAFVWIGMIPIVAFFRVIFPIFEAQFPMVTWAESIKDLTILRPNSGYGRFCRRIWRLRRA